jgi:hypothetical protein
MTDLCAQALERARLYESEHRIALRLQRALLPDRVVEHPSVTIAARYEATSDTMEVGGDWYDTFELPDGRIGVGHAPGGNALAPLLGRACRAARGAAQRRAGAARARLSRPGPRTVEVEITHDDEGGLVARVTDFGWWREPALDVNRGRGTGIMRALSDGVSVDTGPGGTIVTITLSSGAS